MKVITEQIIAETDADLTIKFTNVRGSVTRSKTKTIKKIDGLTNEQLLERWHRRMTIEFIQRPLSFKRELLEQTEE